jgi:hypothetical protein
MKTIAGAKSKLQFAASASVQTRASTLYSFRYNIVLGARTSRLLVLKSSAHLRPFKLHSAVGGGSAVFKLPAQAMRVHTCTRHEIPRGVEAGDCTNFIQNALNFTCLSDISLPTASLQIRTSYQHAGRNNSGSTYVGSLYMRRPLARG